MKIIINYVRRAGDEFNVTFFCRFDELLSTVLSSLHSNKASFDLVLVDEEYHHLLGEVITHGLNPDLLIRTDPTKIDVLFNNALVSNKSIEVLKNKGITFSFLDMVDIYE